MEYKIRLEKPQDYKEVEYITREAFWGDSNAECSEHYLVYLLRNAPSFIAELDFVALLQEKIIGNIMFSKAKVVSAGGFEHEVITFGPLSVLPQYQGKGIGKMLLRHSISEARKMGYKGIVFYGHPDYYPRLGFISSKKYGITAPDGSNFDALMAMPLYDGAFDGVSGTFHEDDVFYKCEKDTAGLKAFNLTMPYKEPAVMPSINILLEKLPPTQQSAFKNKNIHTLATLNRFSGREILQWDGMTLQAMEIINATLTEYGYAPRLLPDSPYLK